MLVTLVLLLFVVQVSRQTSSNKPPTLPGLPTIKDMVTGYGYEETDVEVITEDGYVLWMHRIGNSSGPPLILQHGFMVTAESWVLRGPDQDLAFLLIEAGFDVWLPNLRGTFFNQYHIKMKRTDPKFWDFSFHEFAYYDLPAFIDRILKIRRVNKVYYVGHSMGSNVFHIMASLRPEYNSKVEGAVLLSPASYPLQKDELSNPFLRYFIINADHIYLGLLNSKTYELLPRTSSSIRLLSQFCDFNSPTQELCLDMVGFITGENRKNLNKRKLGFYTRFIPSGTSLKNVYHFLQIHRRGELRQFDYGLKGNILKYNSSIPPEYHTEKVTVPIAIYWSHNDPILSKSSVERLASALPNLTKLVAVTDPKFTHVDMILGENAKDVLYTDVIDTLLEIKMSYESN